jgi:hypothetical protein
MDFTVTFRRSKLARHILMLFFICALLPLLSLSFFSYFMEFKIIFPLVLLLSILIVLLISTGNGF